ncbi:hypothetical protein KEJ32_01220, partial [Candidatus Bathyarchaeota archaeon]|nr:hypothetical protein [Candidatus Bathyarchaeota archaeon]
MKKLWYLMLTSIVLLALFSTMAYAFASEHQVHLMVVEWYGRGKGRVIIYSIPSEDDSMTNPDYKLLPFWWHTTIKYWINPKNNYGFSTSAVVTTITSAANTWD